MADTPSASGSATATAKPRPKATPKSSLVRPRPVTRPLSSGKVSPGTSGTAKPKPRGLSKDAGAIPRTPLASRGATGLRTSPPSTSSGTSSSSAHTPLASSPSRTVAPKPRAKVPASTTKSPIPSSKTPKAPVGTRTTGTTVARGRGSTVRGGRVGTSGIRAPRAIGEVPPVVNRVEQPVEPEKTEEATSPLPHMLRRLSEGPPPPRSGSRERLLELVEKEDSVARQEEVGDNGKKEGGEEEKRNEEETAVVVVAEAEVEEPVVEEVEKKPIVEEVEKEEPVVEETESEEVEKGPVVEIVEEVEKEEPVVAEAESEEVEKEPVVEIVEEVEKEEPVVAEAESEEVEKEPVVEIVEEVEKEEPVVEETESEEVEKGPVVEIVEEVEKEEPVVAEAESEKVEKEPVVEKKPIVEEVEKEEPVVEETESEEVEKGPVVEIVEEVEKEEPVVAEAESEEVEKKPIVEEVEKEEPVVEEVEKKGTVVEEEERQTEKIETEEEEEGEREASPEFVLINHDDAINGEGAEESDQDSVVVVGKESGSETEEDTGSVVIKEPGTSNVGRQLQEQSAQYEPIRHDLRSFVCQYEANNPCEDCFFVNDGVGFFGVFDGHGGYDTAEFMRRRIYEQILQSLARCETVEEALVDAYVQVDEEFMDNAISTSEGLETSGSCACSILFVENKLYVANVGDSRAVLGRRGHDGKMTAIPLSVDQNTSNDNEIKLVMERSSDPVAVRRHEQDEKEGPLRVAGHLLVTRAMGDAYLKRASFSAPPMSDHLPYITCEPEVQCHEITQNDEFVVLASDGLWEHMDNEEVVTFVKANECTQVADKLVQRLLRKVAEDKDISHEIMCSLPPGMRRLAHDDISILVIYLHHKGDMLLGRESSTTSIVTDATEGIPDREYADAEDGDDGEDGDGEDGGEEEEGDDNDDEEEDDEYDEDAPDAF